MAKNNNLHAAKRNKDNEFYTCQFDILQEIQHYTDQFEDKIIYLPCDDAGDELWNVPEDRCLEYKGSQFWYVFAQCFTQYKLKKLICTCYREGSHGVKLTIDRDDLVTAEDKRWPYAKAKRELLEGDGDFRSEECAKFFDECDIVITNPPFSIFTTFVDIISNKNKQMLIIGNKNAITYKEVFKLIKEDKLWLGYTSPNEFKTPDGLITKKVQGLCRWFTNLGTTKRYEELCLFEKYSEEKYPEYDNYKAIHIGKTIEIPVDFDGLMAVPITFLDKYNPNQFTIVGEANNGSDSEYDLFKPLLHGEYKYKRLLIKWKKNG